MMSCDGYDWLTSCGAYTNFFISYKVFAANRKNSQWTLEETLEKSHVVELFKAMGDRWRLSMGKQQRKDADEEQRHDADLPKPVEGIASCSLVHKAKFKIPVVDYFNMVKPQHAILDLSLIHI